MSIAAAGTKSLDMIAVALHGLDAIADMARKVHSFEGHSADRLTGALEVLGAIEKVVDSIRGGFHGKVDPKTIHDDLAKLGADLAANDHAAESDLDKKFPR